MLHIYRQITGLKRCAPVVIAQKRENAERYPFEPLHLVPKPRTHVLRRFWFRQLRDKPWQISDAELSQLLSVLSETRARFLHIYFGQIAVHLTPLIRVWKPPSIVSFHGADVMVDMNKSDYREATLQMLDAITLVLVRSESLRRALMGLGCDPEKIEIQRTGIPREEFPFRERAVPKNGEWRFVQAGRLIEKKGLPVTLRAFEVFVRQYPNATLTIAGEGPLLTELKTLARELKIAARVSFTGFLSQEQFARPITGRTFSCTRARLAAMEIRKVFRIQCSKRWLPGSRYSRQSTAAFPKQSSTASVACSCLSVTNSHWWKRCWMRCKTPGSFQALHRPAPKPCEEISISPHKRNGSKTSICG